MKTKMQRFADALVASGLVSLMLLAFLGGYALANLVF